MSRETYVQIAGKFVLKARDGNLTPEYLSACAKRDETAMIMRDIEPYVSPLDRKVIGSRSTHRDHMREHRVVEVGNEYNKYLTQPFKREVVGDFNARRELAQATHHVLNRR